MVRGLDRFRDHFSAFSDRYVLIGGTACDLVMREVGVDFRATRDLDIVLCIETLDPDFAQAFWSFVKQGGYGRRESSAGTRRFYRFQKPTDSAYPAMLELFSRVPDALTISGMSHLTPIPIDGAVSSLSAILLDDRYYHWIHGGRVELEGVPIVGAKHLIPLKARAWIDLSERKNAGERIDGSDVKKHRNDVFRLLRVINPERTTLPEAIREDMRRFVEKAGGEPDDLELLKKVYGLE